MYIEFSLPTGAGGMAAGYTNAEIERVLSQWSSHHQINYISKTIKYTKRVTFERDESYTVFAMTWSQFCSPKKPFLSKWRIVSDPNNKTTFDFAV